MDKEVTDNLKKFLRTLISEYEYARETEQGNESTVYLMAFKIGLKDVHKRHSGFKRPYENST